MQRLFFSLVLFFIIVEATAQSTPGTPSAKAFGKGDKLLNLGIGIGTPYWGSGFSSSVPVNPTLTYETGVDEEISAGATVSYNASKYFDWKYTGIYFGARGSYHFDIAKPNIDLYAGGGIGYVVVSLSNKTYGYTASAGSGAGYSVFGGARYYLGRLAVYGELGYGSFSILNAGVSFKL